MKTGRPKKNTSATTVRIDFELKKEAEAICDEMGLTLSTVYVMLLKAIVRNRAIPFKLVEVSEQIKQD